MTAQSNMLEVRVEAIRNEAEGINSFDLRPITGAELPPFTAGAHIDIYLPNKLVRSYSLVNPQGERHRYIIAVNKDSTTRGGSRFMHESVRVSDTLTIGMPRNNFPLTEDANHTVLIAGGIGITPLWCMIQRLGNLGRSWELHFSARTRRNAAFLEQLQTLGSTSPGQIYLNFDYEPGGKLLDLSALVKRLPPEAHLYCCGPLPMLDAFEKAVAAWSPDQIHVEYFTPRMAPTSGGFTVVLARSGQIVVVPPNQTILQTLLDCGMKLAFACTEGHCGTCETRVLEGIPDHRDIVLTELERASNKVMMICCSGSKSDQLVLDL